MRAFVGAAMKLSRAEIADEIRAQVTARGAGKTICRSEVARALADDWRDLMDNVRAVAGDLAEAGEVTVTQRGAPVDVRTARGPVRLGL